MYIPNEACQHFPYAKDNGKHLCCLHGQELDQLYILIVHDKRGIQIKIFSLQGNIFYGFAGQH